MLPLLPSDPEVLADRDEELRALRLEPDEREAEPIPLESADLPF